MVSIAVLAPNLLILIFPPRDSPPEVSVPLVFAWLERSGQALCLVLPALTEPRGTVWWSAPAALALTGYYALWGRYVLRERTFAGLYRPAGGVPVPMAILPVLIFLATAAWFASGWIAAAAALLAAGHIPASLVIARAVKHDRRENLAKP
jgi:hypothetical protein